MFSVEIADIIEKLFLLVQIGNAVKWVLFLDFWGDLFQNVYIFISSHFN